MRHSVLTSQYRGTFWVQKIKNFIFSQCSLAPAWAFFSKKLFFTFFSAPGAPLELKTPEMKRGAFSLLSLDDAYRGRTWKIKNKIRKRILFLLFLFFSFFLFALRFLDTEIVTKRRKKKRKLEKGKKGNKLSYCHCERIKITRKQR